MIKELLAKIFGDKEVFPAMSPTQAQNHQEETMTTYTVFGTGNMATAIATLLNRGGSNVEHIGSAESANATINGSVVILAVPYPAVEGIIANHVEALAGKVVIDITNPLDFETFDSLTVAADGSATAEIAAALPQSRVLKAFNTTFASTLVSGRVGGQTTTVLVAGDDADAKAALGGIVTSAGLRAVDAGSMDRARELEAIGFLQITLAAREKISWTGGFGVAA